MDFMEIRSLIVGIVIAGVVVAGAVGATSVWDSLQGPVITDVSVERLNDTHAAVAWATEKPTYGYISTDVHRHCGSGWGINMINDSSFTQTHLVIAPIYELNRSRVNQSSVPGNKSLWMYHVTVSAWREPRPEGASAGIKRILTRNISGGHPNHSTTICR